MLALTAICGRERLRRAMISLVRALVGGAAMARASGVRESKAHQNDAFGLSGIIRLDQGSTESRPTSRKGERTTSAFLRGQTLRDYFVANRAKN